MIQFWMIKLQSYNQHQVSLLKAYKRAKILVIGCWITYHQNQRWLFKLSNRLRIKLKKLCKKRDTSFQFKESKSALKKFALQYGIKGLNEYDPESFLLNSKLPIRNLMINTRQTKVKLILSCMMEKVGLKIGEVIAKEAAFHSKTEDNLESTNSNELFSKMKETVLEILFSFESGSSHSKV